MAIEDRQAEFNELCRRAMNLLKGRDGIEPRDPIRGLLPELRLWHYPAFSSHKSWTIFKSRSQNSESVVREVTWDFPADHMRLTDPLIGLKQGFHTDPSVTVRDGKLLDDELSVLIDKGRRLN